MYNEIKLRKWVMFVQLWKYNDKINYAIRHADRQY